MEGQGGAQSGRTPLGDRRGVCVSSGGAGGTLGGRALLRQEGREHIMLGRRAVEAISRQGFCGRAVVRH